MQAGSRRFYRGEEDDFNEVRQATDGIDETDFFRFKI